MRCSSRLAALVAVWALTLPTPTWAQTAWPTPDWEVAAPASQGMSADTLDRVGKWLEEHGSKTGMVVRHGRIVGEWYFGDATPETRLLVYSTTKSFSSTAVGLLIQEGLLSLDTTLEEVLDDVTPPEKGRVTVRNIISMNTGVHNNPEIHEMEKLFSYSLREAPMDFLPGEKWDYNNTGLSLLSPLVLKVSGQEVDQILNEDLFRPIGIEEDDWEWEYRQDHAIPYSGLHITARALARFGLLFLNQGRWQDETILPAEWVAESIRPSQKQNEAYGYLWWNNTTGRWPGVPEDAFAALGRFDNDMLVVPSLDLIVIRQVGDDTEKNHQMQIGELFKLAVDAIEK